MDKACALIESARGLDLVAFSETYVGGYPFFSAAAPSRAKWETHALYLEHAVEIPSPEVARLADAARAASVDVVIGIAERDPVSRGSVYCTLLFIARDGTLLGRHRKLRPTYDERMVWADGDASGLVVHDRGYARVSGLNCWEHQMVLPGYALMREGAQLHVSAWPGGEPTPPADGYDPLSPRQLLLSRALAVQGAAYVLCAGAVCRPSDVPEGFEELLVFPFNGASYIVNPFGEVVAGPAEGETLITATYDPAQVRAAKASNDIAGHYSRPDVFTVDVRRPAPSDLGGNHAKGVRDDA